jgi:hypothetical protein
LAGLIERVVVVGVWATMSESSAKGKARPKKVFFKKEPMGRALLVVPPQMQTCLVWSHFHTEKLEAWLVSTLGKSYFDEYTTATVEPTQLILGICNL